MSVLTYNQPNTNHKSPISETPVRKSSSYDQIMSITSGANNTRIHVEITIINFIYNYYLTVYR